MNDFIAGMKVRALLEGEWEVAYIYEVVTLSDGSKKYKVKRRDWNVFGEVTLEQLERLGRGSVMATNTKYAVGQQVESLQGTTWYSATILEKKNNLYYIKYDQYEEWDWVGDEDLKGTPIVQNPEPIRLSENTENDGGGSNATRYLVILNKGALYRVSAKDGSFTMLSPDWMEVSAMAASGDSVFLISKGKLFRISVETGRYEELGGGWDAVKDMVAL